MFQVYLDSDGPIADFDHDLKRSGLSADEFKHLPGIYLWLPITEGASAALEVLKKYDDSNELRVWILTKTPSGSPYAYTEKVLWYKKNFPWLEDRVILTHDKSLIGTRADMLLDDRPHKANADKFRGTFVLFKTDKPIDSWLAFLKKILVRTSARAAVQGAIEK
jgi:5'(3')-deoxyribonucleotidase